MAPRLLPPCLICWVLASNTLKKETGPLATPPVVLTISFFGRRREKENPVPPPDLCIKAACFTESNILSIESSTGRTKQADSCCRSKPAFISVGELKQKSNSH